MKHIKYIIATLVVAGSTTCLMAQDGGNDSAPRQRPPLPPVMAVLDANHDGVIDAAEIDNAPAALRKLDKNGDGKLTQDELRPPRQAGGPGNGLRNGPRNGHRPPRDGAGHDVPPPADDQEQQ
ncbi:MAG TPA: hypothetical protein VK327_05395 [Candidatus Paceibacterota bacterium]|nr:hypothetical protein [Candidatus Paceibacterota bacterium]